jgi:hypothetical protein
MAPHIYYAGKDQTTFFILSIKRPSLDFTLNQILNILALKKSTVLYCYRGVNGYLLIKKPVKIPYIYLLTRYKYI